MPEDHDLQPVLDFLSDLEQNNDRAWFERNRAAYDHARAAFERFVDALIVEVGAFDDLGGISARDCVFRIYRDVRFSKDKSPYKTNMGASLAPGGRRAAEIPYYLHLEPHDRSFIAGGLYAPSPEQLANVRLALERDAAELKRVIGSRAFAATFGALDGERLKTAPQGFPRDHPEIELLKYKQFVVRHPLADRDVLTPDFLTRVTHDFRTLKPLLDVLREMVM
jgi:uncharacterized protein (TIGR02453 family)